MEKYSLEKYVQSLLPMSPEKAHQVAENFMPIEIEKNEFILKEQKTSRATYYLESGFVRSFTFDNNGNEVTTNIYSAPCFVNDFLSFFKQQPSQENLQSLTHCKLWKMSFEQVQISFHNIPEFREFGRLMLVTNYSHLHERMLGMIKDTAETRYLKMLERHPDVFQHVLLKVIASYLGITDSSLSRIRKEIMQK
jgi:CRP-like cAMP-binding protein